MEVLCNSINEDFFYEKSAFSELFNENFTGKIIHRGQTFYSTTLNLLTLNSNYI